MAFHKFHRDRGSMGFIIKDFRFQATAGHPYNPLEQDILKNESHEIFYFEHHHPIDNAFAGPHH